MKQLRTILMFAIVPVFCWVATIHAESSDDAGILVLERIECVGNSNVSCDFIRSRLALKPGNRIVDGEVANARLRLFSLSQFRFVDMYLRKGSERGKVVLVVEVEESSPLVTEVVSGIGSIVENQADNSPEVLRTLERLSGRIGYQNLFDRQKILELTVNGSRSEIDNFSLKTQSESLTYLDPSILGSQRYFGSLDFSHYHYQLDSQKYTSLSSGTVSASTTTADVLTIALGMRLWEYAYGFAGYQQTSGHVAASTTFRDTFIPLAFSIHSTNKYVGVGWNSEDDPYFPTRGFVSAAGFSSYRSSTPGDENDDSWSVAARSHWMIGQRSVISVDVGGDPAVIADRIRPLESNYDSATLVLRYSYLFARGDTLAKQHRRTWYAQLGTGPVELRKGGRIGGHPDLAVVTAGLRFETKWIGMVDLYVSAGRSWPR